MRRVRSQHVKRGDVVRIRGEERKVKGVRTEERSGRRQVVLVLVSGPPERLKDAEWVELSDNTPSRRKNDGR